jgi:predicted ATP-grasp superfamily ATP-dependent carboligase/thymidylate kinase
MFTVALIGADGAGKTTIGRRLENTLPLPVKYVYMGINLDASNHMLPTTRLLHFLRRAWGIKPDNGPPDPDRVQAASKGLVQRTTGNVRTGLSLAVRLSEEWFRQVLAWHYQRRGNIVLFDRHYFSDYYAHDIARNGRPRPLSKRIHGFMLERVYPKPDLVIFLDAPPEVLFARKGEGTLKALEHRRQEYLQMRSLVKHFAVVDARPPEDDVAYDVSELIKKFQREQTGCRSAGTLQSANHRPSVLVTDAGRGKAIAIIRSLGRRGWRVLAADSCPRSPGFYSRFATERLLYPCPHAAPQEFVETLLDAVRRRGIDLLIPVTELVILPLAEARHRFEGACKLALPEATALAAVLDKRRTVELAEHLGVPVPRTRQVHSTQEALRECASFAWPVVLKPWASKLHLGQAIIEAPAVCYARTEEELARYMERFEGRCPVLLQEYCGGPGQGVELLLHNGRPLAAFQHKRLREVPIHGGQSAFRESVPLDPVLYAYAVRLLRELKWTGLAMVEFKVGPAGPKLMEINGRVWGSLPLAVRSGMDFPARLAELYLHGPPDHETMPDTSYTVGVRARDLELEMVWIVSVLAGRWRDPIGVTPSRCQGLKALVQLFNPAYKFDILSLNDPCPGLAEILKIISRFAGRL